MGTRDLVGWTDEAPIDLSALDPDLDREAEVRLVQGVLQGRRQSYPIRRDLLVTAWVTDWPALAGAAAIAAMTLLVVGLSTRPSAKRPLTVAESIGVPAEFLDASTDPARRGPK